MELLDGGKIEIWTLLKPPRQPTWSSAPLEHQEHRAWKCGYLDDFSKELRFHNTHLVKLNIPGWNANCAGQSSNLWEEDPDRQPSPVRATPEIARQIIQTVWETRQMCWVSYSILSLYHLESVALLSLIISLDYLSILWGALIDASRPHLDRQMWSLM